MTSRRVFIVNKFAIMPLFLQWLFYWKISLTSPTRFNHDFKKYFGKSFYNPKQNTTFVLKLKIK